MNKYFSSPELNVRNGRFSDHALCVVRRQKFFKTSSPPKSLGQVGPNLAVMFLGKSSLNFFHRN